VFFDLKRGQLSAPVMLTLSPQDDTGVSSSDHITQGGSVPGQPSQHQVTISGDTKTTSLVEVKVFNDKNKNGVFDTGDTLIDTFDQQGTSAFSKAYSFVDGEYNLRYSLTDRSSGQSSAPSDMLTITIDNSVSPPSNVVVGLNGPLNLLTYENGTTVILGKGEPYAKLFIQVQDKLTGQALLTTPWEVTVGADGNWRLNLSKAQLDQLQEGQLVAVFTQQDRAGNVSQSTQVDTWFDITPPDVPDVQLIADTLNNYYQNQNKPKPWDRPNQGVIWTFNTIVPPKPPNLKPSPWRSHCLPIPPPKPK
jgi:hypothetical protein